VSCIESVDSGVVLDKTVRLATFDSERSFDEVKFVPTLYDLLELDLWSFGRRRLFEQTVLSSRSASNRDLETHLDSVRYPNRPAVLRMIVSGQIYPLNFAHYPSSRQIPSVTRSRN